MIKRGICASVLLLLGLLVVAWVLGGWQATFVLVFCWLAETLMGYILRRRTLGENVVARVDQDRWASSQVACLGSGLAVLCMYHLAQGVELPVEDRSLIRWLVAMSPVVMAFFALAAASLWLSTVLLSRSLRWRRMGALTKVLIAASLGFLATSWPLAVLQGAAALDHNLVVLGGMGSGASVISLLFELSLEERGYRRGFGSV